MKRRFFFWAAVVGLFLDQLTKILVHGMYRSGAFDRTCTIGLVGSLLRLAYEKNQQGVFGLKYGPKFLYFVLPLSASALVAWLGLKARDWWSATAYGAIMAGALGNVIDRARFGYVIDFIVFEVRRLGFRWYTFNLADTFVVVGCIMLLAKEFLCRPKAEGRSQMSEAGSAVAAEHQEQAADEQNLPR
jgi:signal peptidase II